MKMRYFIVAVKLFLHALFFLSSMYMGLAVTLALAYVWNTEPFGMNGLFAVCIGATAGFTVAGTYYVNILAFFDLYKAGKFTPL